MNCYSQAMSSWVSTHMPASTYSHTQLQKHGCPGMAHQDKSQMRKDENELQEKLSVLQMPSPLSLQLCRGTRRHQAQKGLSFSPSFCLTQSNQTLHVISTPCPQLPPNLQPLLQSSTQAPAGNSELINSPRSYFFFLWWITAFDKYTPSTDSKFAVSSL